MASATVTLISAFWRVSTFRLAPQDIPKSPILLAIVTVANLALTTIINQIQLDFAASVLVAGLEMVVLISLTAALLLWFSHLPRLTQTLTALMGCGAVIGSLVFGLLQIFPELPEGLRIVIFFWNLMVMAHVLRHALAIHLAAAFFCALGYAVVLIQLIVFIGRGLGASS